MLPQYARSFECKHIPGDADVQDRGREKFTDPRVLDSFAVLSFTEQLLTMCLTTFLIAM